MSCLIVEGRFGSHDTGVWLMHSESQWRYRAYRKGLRLVKYKESSSGYERYGPYALVDRTTRTVVATNLDAEAVERELCSPA